MWTLKLRILGLVRLSLNSQGILKNCNFIQILRLNFLDISTFTQEEKCRSLHTQKSSQLFYQPEPDFWMVMVR